MRKLERRTWARTLALSALRASRAAGHAPPVRTRWTGDWRIFVLVGAVTASTACVNRCPSTTPATPKDSPTTRALHALFEQEWEHDLAEAPIWASSIGDRRYDTKWDDVSLTAQTRREAHEREVLRKVSTIVRAELPASDALSYDVFRFKYETAIDAQAFRLYLFPLNQRGGIQTADELADELPFATVKSYADWNARLAAFPAYMDQTIELLEEGLRTRMVHPRIAMKRVVAQIDAQIVTDATKSPFYVPYEKIDARVGAADRERLASDARRLVTSSIVPAFAKLRAFFVEKYLPAGRETVGAWDLPNGAALYAFTARAHTTTRLTPDQIHAIGLREVARIRREMETVKARAGFTGPLGDFFTFLRTDPRFFYEDADALLAGYR